MNYSPGIWKKRSIRKGDILLLDIREPYEFDAMHIKDAINVPRGVLETACDYDYEETVPELVEAREREIILICRSGKRSVLAADVMQQMGYRQGQVVEDRYARLERL